MTALSVLLTNNALGVRAGSEIYLRDVALALLARGHRPVAFSLVHGEVADELRRATIPVVDDLTRLGSPPDVIHGHHHLETLIAALAFPGVPIVHFCHGWLPWEEKPLRHPSIHRYVAVDEVCADRLVREEGIAAGDVETLLNFVDLARFRPREPLPARPVRAVIFSNHAQHGGSERYIRAACDAHEIALDVIGLDSGAAVREPEAVLPQYDLVFAKARAALEAMAVGCAVVVTDWMGCGPLVTPENFERLRRHNFGVRELQRPHETAWYSEQIAAYRAEAAAAVSDRVRHEADLVPAVDRLVKLYEQAVASAPASGDPQRAAARHLQTIARPLKEAAALRATVQRLEQTLLLARQACDGLVSEREAFVSQGATAEARARAARAEAVEAGQVLQARLDEAEARGAALAEALAAYQRLSVVRLRDAVLRLPVVGAAAQRATRFLARKA